MTVFSLISRHLEDFENCLPGNPLRPYKFHKKEIPHRIERLDEFVVLCLFISTNKEVVSVRATASFSHTIETYSGLPYQSILIYTYAPTIENLKLLMSHEYLTMDYFNPELNP